MANDEFRALARELKKHRRDLDDLIDTSDDLKERIEAAEKKANEPPPKPKRDDD